MTQNEQVAAVAAGVAQYATECGIECVDLGAPWPERHVEMVDGVDGHRMRVWVGPRLDRAGMVDAVRIVVTDPPSDVCRDRFFYPLQLDGPASSLYFRFEARLVRPWLLYGARQDDHEGVLAEIGRVAIRETFRRLTPWRR